MVNITNPIPQMIKGAPRDTVLHKVTDLVRGALPRNKLPNSQTLVPSSHRYPTTD